MIVIRGRWTFHATAYARTGHLLMRRPFALFASIMLAACSSSATPTGNTPPPPPPAAPGAPAAITIVAGDGQQGLPGSVLPVKPAVLVKDASGVPVPGVTVLFAIDSGSGSLASTSATTGTDGTAVAGSWTLGPVAGSNVVRVTVGSLAVVRIHATALGTTARSIFANAAVGSGGGTLQYNKVGDALNGLSIVVPAAAYPTATSWSITADSTIPVPLPAGFTQVGPVLIVTNGQGYADSLMTLTMPMHIDQTTDAVAPFYFDPVSQTLEPIPMVDQTDTSATLATEHFSGSLMAIPGSGASLGSLRGSLRAGFGSVEIVWVKTPAAQLAGTFTSTFQPGVDDWEFANYGDYASPGGDCEGMSVTAMFYHYFFRLGAAPKPSLYHQFDQSLANQWDNVQGIRFAGSVQADYDKRFAAGIDQRRILTNQATAKGAKLQALTSSWIALTLKLNKHPVLMALASASDGHAVVAFAATSSGAQTVVSFADPNFPGQVRTMTFQSGVLTPVSLQVNAAAAGDSYPFAYAVGVTSDVPLTQIQSRWTQFTNQTAGSDRYPAGYSFIADTGTATGFSSETWSAMGDTVYTLPGRFNAALLCPNCPSKYAGILPSGRMVGLLWDSAGATALADGSAAVTVPPGNTTFVVVGLAKSPYDTTAPGFVDWKRVTVTYLKGSITPASPTQVVGTPLSLTFQATPNLLPAHVTYSWNFGDGTAVVTMADNASVQHTYTTAGSYTVTAQALTASTNQPITRATTIAVISSPALHWRLTSLTLVSQQGDPAPPDRSIGAIIYWQANDLLAQAVMTPNTTTIQVGTGAGGAGMAVTFSLSPDIMDFSLAATPSLVPMATLTITGTTNSGSITGSWPATGTPQTISATMNQGTLSGTFSIDLYYASGGPPIYYYPQRTYSFTATLGP
jgi:PKD repeat protein